MVNTMEEIDQVLESQTKHLHKVNEKEHEIEKQRLRVLEAQLKYYIETDFKEKGLTTKEERRDYAEVKTFDMLVSLSDLKKIKRTAQIEADMLEKRYDALLIKFNREG